MCCAFIQLAGQQAVYPSVAANTSGALLYDFMVAGEPLSNRDSHYNPTGPPRMWCVTDQNVLRNVGLSIMTKWTLSQQHEVDLTFCFISF